MPSITWKKAMGKLPGDYKPVRQLGLNAHIAENGSLVVTNVREGHEGYYLCQASNGVGAELSKVVYVDIHVPAHFEMKARNQTATKGSIAALLCEVRGDLPLSIVWKYKGNRLDTTGDNRFNVKERATSSGLVSELLVSRIDRKDNGQYSCQATNAFGRDEAKIQLYVKEPPEAPKRLKSPEHSSRSVQLQWIPSFDGNSPVTRFIVQFKTTSETWHPRSHNITIPGHEPRAEVDTLRPAVTYQFRVLAENEVGTSDPSTAIAVTTSEEAPSGPPLDVQVDSPSSHSLRVRWKPPVRELWNGQIQGYRIGYRNVAAGKPYLFKTMELANEAALEYLLTGLEKFTKYGITVEAFNREGSGPRASEVVASTLEDVPSEAPQFVQCKTLSSKSIQIVWNAPVTSSIHGVLQGYRLLYIPVDPASDDSKAHSTTVLKTELHGLKKYTNYSLQVAAFNRAGVGRYSEKIFCRTEEDVPSPPAEIKALVMSSDAIIVSWRPPESPNGILTKYNVYMKDQTDRNLRPTFNTLPPVQTYYEMRGLQEGKTYEFWVTASTVVGEGESSDIVTQSPVSTVPAKIASFQEYFVIDPKDEIRLPCRAVGIPTPDREWMVRGQRLQEGSRIKVLSDGSLAIQSVRNSDAGNYTCRVSNIYASGEIIHVIAITGAQTQKVPPTAPSLRLFSRTGTSISIKWEVEDDGGDPIQGFTLRYKQDSKEWKEVILGSEEELFALDNLQCGTRYQLYLTAHNAVGTSDPSDVLTVSTKGQPPQIPERAKFLQVNSTYITLDLGTWLDGGCPLLYFVIEYKLKEENEWHVVSSNVEPRKEAMTVEKLTPGTWYSLRVKAYNDAGASTVEYDFPTLLGLYGTDSPDSLMKKNTDRAPLFMDLNVLIPVISIAFLIILGVAVVCLVYQCRHRNGYKHSKATRNDIRGAPGGNDFSKRLTGGSSPAFTQLPSSTSARKPSSPSESPFSQPRYDEPGIHGDICPYATAQLSSCYTEDPASMQLKTFAVGGHKLEHMTSQQSEAPDTARIYAKPVKLLKSSDNSKTENNEIIDKKNSKPDQEIKQVWISDKQETAKTSPPYVKGTNSLLPSAPPAEYDSSPTDSDTPELGLRRKSVYTDDHSRPRLRCKPLHRSKIPDLLYHGGDSSSSNEESVDGDCKETSQNERVKSRPVSRRHSKMSHRNSSPESTPEETSYNIRDYIGVPPEFSDRFANSENPGQKGIKSQAKEDSRRPTSLTLADEEEELIALLRRGPTSASNPSGREEIITRT